VSINRISELEDSITRRLGMADVRTVDDLISLCEELFRVQHGPARAFFELPQPNAEPVRVIYRSYVVAGDSEDELIQWMEDNVLRPLNAKGGRWLWYRLPTGFELTYDHEAKRHTLRTRLGVLDDKMTAVTLPEVEKPEGMPNIGDF
jgi:hypothetical protein